MRRERANSTAGAPNGKSGLNSFIAVNGFGVLIQSQSSSYLVSHGIRTQIAPRVHLMGKLGLPYRLFIY